MPSQSIQPLGRVFWLHAAAPRILALTVLWTLNRTGASPGSLVLWPLLAGDVLLLAWQARSFQVSADDHIRHHGSLAPVWGGQLAFLFAAFAGAALWWGVFLEDRRQDIPDLFTERMDQQHAATYRLTLSPDGTELRFEGLVTFGLTARLEDLLQSHPEATSLTLSSNGGHIYEARGAAQAILAHGLATRTDSTCSSACTLLFAAGSTRDMAEGARLGFHGYGLEGGGVLPHIDIAAEQEKDRAYFRGRGAKDAFLDRIFGTPQSSLWYLDRPAARDAGLLTP